MLSYTDLKKGVIFIYEGQPYEVVEASFLRMQQRKAVVQTKIRNLATGKILDRNWQASDEFEEAEVNRTQAVFIYEGKGEYWFHKKGDPRSRFSLTAGVVGEQGKFLKPQTEVAALVFGGKTIKVSMPIKMEFKVTEAPPSIKGNTTQGGSKQITVEGGAVVSAPLFVNQGDVIRVNTETGEYVERVEKV